MAYDVDKKSAVVLREFFPEAIAKRKHNKISVMVDEAYQESYFSLLNDFLDMWRNIARIRGFSALIPVVDIIEENNTAYAVTEHIESLTLREFLLRSKTGYLNWEKAKVLFMPVLSLLSNLHQSGIVHYGISPDTLLIGRDGKLYMGQYGSTSADTVPSSFRYSSNLSDYRTTYDGLYSVYKNDAVQEYVSNTNVGGLVLDLGTNPFLQFTDQSNRLDALQDSWDGIYYVPFTADMPLVPIYDPGDVLTFTDNQAGAYDLGAITEITYNIGGTMHVLCSGDNPRLASAQDRFSKTIAGLASEYSNGQEVGAKNFWILTTENTSPITVGSTKTEVAEIEWNQTVDVQRLGLMFTCDGDLSDTAVVKILITVDDLNDYEFEVTESKSLLGKRTYNSTCGFRVTGKGTHVAKVYMTVTDSALKWSDLA